MVASTKGGLCLIVSAIVSGIIQVLVFSLIPYVAYLFTARRRQRFLQYVGLTGAPGKAVAYGAVLGLASFPLMFGLLTVAGADQLLLDPSSQTGRLRELAAGDGAATMLFVAAFQSVVTTALSEEILFRGFLAKRFMAWLGFRVGNVLQGIVFGVLHGFLFLGAATELPLVGWLAVVLLPAVQGWLMGWLNERLGGGSIVPSWCAHAVGNVMTFTIIPLVL